MEREGGPADKELATATRRRVGVACREIAAGGIRTVGHEAVAFNAEIVRQYSRLPMAGRSAIRTLYTNCRVARTAGQKTRSFLALAGTTCVMTAGHAFQLLWGLNNTILRVGQIASTPTPGHIGLAILDGLYTAANAGAIHAQLSVTAGVAARLRKPPTMSAAAGRELKVRVSRDNNKRVMGDLAFTLAGQFAFMLTAAPHTL